MPSNGTDEIFHTEDCKAATCGVTTLSLSDFSVKVFNKQSHEFNNEHT